MLIDFIKNKNKAFECQANTVTVNIKMAKIYAAAYNKHKRLVSLIKCTDQ